MNILIIHASAGAGHMKAGEALYNGLKKSTTHHVEFIDALDYSSPFFKTLYKSTYFFLISRVPWLWGFFFQLLDIACIQGGVRMIRRIYNAINVRKLQRYLCERQFDYIFMTHFMPTEITAALKRTGKISSRLVTVITDFDVHKIWLADGIDTYAVASEWTKHKLHSLGIPEEKIFVSGIPTDERFSAPVDVRSLKEGLGLWQDAFTVLVATGSFGIGPIRDIIHALKNFQVIVVCGHNKTLYEDLRGENLSYVKVYALVDNMHELMAVSDVMVTKPGGLSISEALVRHLPLIFFNAIPGQEKGNVRVLKEHGIGISNCTIEQIANELEQMKSSREIFHNALKRTEVLARPSAVFDILSLVK